MAKVSQSIRSKLASAAREGLRKGKAERFSQPIEYIRFRNEFRGIERGTVITAKGKRVIWGYPHIRRVFTLKDGLKKNLEADTVYAEEKIDGFNVRIASISGQVYAFSRGGFLDLFVTDKAREMKLERFFEDYPDHVLYAEMIGNTPYTTPTSRFDVRLFVFDIGRPDGSYLPCDERYRMIKEYGIRGVPVLGKFKGNDYKGLETLAVVLNKSSREGMVVKSSDRAKAVKYVTLNSDIGDIEETSDILFDMPIGFFYQRILRSAFFMDDFSLERKKYAEKLGQAFYRGLIRSIQQARKGEEIGAEFEILVSDPSVWEDIHRHMSRDVRLEKLWARKEGRKTRIRFRKIYRRTTKMLAGLASGKGVTD